MSTKIMTMAAMTLCCGFILMLDAGCTSSPDPVPVLAGIARMDADSFFGGPTSGQFIEGANGVAAPFVQRQPVQGFSSILKLDDGTYLALADNGFGSRQNSPDYVLQVFRLKPEFRTAAGGSGRLEAEPYFSLCDPDRHIPFQIMADRETYADEGSPIAVDPVIKSNRLLTGADLDVESFCRLPDGTFWFGEEFGPFLVHTDGDGRVLSPPVEHPDLRSPFSPLLGGREVTVHGSGGFEAMGRSPDSRYLYPFLEKPLQGAADDERRIYRFDLQAGQYDGRKPLGLYRTERDAIAVTEMTMINAHRFLVIERDGGEGNEARLKQVFLVDLDRTDADGYLTKTLLVDLLAIPDPDRLGGGDQFRFPFETIESVVVVDERTIGVVNDNNYPFSPSRAGPGRPQDTEFILIRFDRPLAEI